MLPTLRKASYLLTQKVFKNPKNVSQFIRPMSQYMNVLSNNFENGRKFYSKNTGNVQITEIKKTHAEELLSNYDTILLDCDGVLWRTDDVTPLPGVPEAISKLRALGKQVLFVTNNSRLSRDICTEKFLEHKIEPGSPEDLFCVAYSIAVYLKDVLSVTGSVYCIGSKGMETELTVGGLKNFGTGEDPDSPSQETKDLLQMYFRDDVQAVVVGFDPYFNYVKLFKATSYLKNPQCHFIVPTASGRSVSIASNKLQPLTGPIVSAVQMAANRDPVIIGKPACHMFETIRATHPDIDRSRCLMIGDSLNADIGFARECGMDSALVLTGSATVQAVRDITNPQHLPNYILSSLAELNF